MMHITGFVDSLLALNSSLAAVDSSVSGGMGTFGVALIIYLILVAVVTILFIVALWIVFQKAGRPGWAAIVPVYNFWVLFELVGYPGWWSLLMLVPIVNIFPVVISLVAYFKLAKLFGKSDTFAFLNVLFPFVCTPILAFGGATMDDAGGSQASAEAAGQPPQAGGPVPGDNQQAQTASGAFQPYATTANAAPAQNSDVTASPVAAQDQSQPAPRTQAAPAPAPAPGTPPAPSTQPAPQAQPDVAPVPVPGDQPAPEVQPTSQTQPTSGADPSSLAAGPASPAEPSSQVEPAQDTSRQPPQSQPQPQPLVNTEPSQDGSTQDQSGPANNDQTQPPRIG